MNRLVSTLTTMGLGAGLMYFYDPRSGRRRRAQIRDQFKSSVNDAQEFWNEAMVDLKNRSQGMMDRTRSMAQRGTKQMDEGRMGIAETGMAGELTPGIRLLMAGGGGTMALYGRMRKGIVGTALSLAGLGLAARGIANMELKKIVGMGEARDAVKIRKTINIDATPEEVYTFWQNFENFPKFMSNIKEIRRTDEGTYHWVASGPAGATVEWDATITEQTPSQVIAWESTEGSPVKSRGRVRFDPNNRGGTRVTVDMVYTPPAGAVGHMVATMFGKNPRQQMNEDMVRLKSLFETGKTTVEGREVRRDDLAGETGG